MYWPGITDAIKDSISAFKVCLTFSDKQQCEPYSADTVTRLWSYLSLDNFEFQGQHYIMILDMSTKFIVVRMVQSLSTNCTIQILTLVFSEHGLPLNIRCDRGRNFVSDHFQDYCSHLGINLTFSSAYHHSSNPAERAIRTIKMLMKRCSMAKQSWRLALLEYLTTPLDGNTPSPSELNGRKFNSLFPNVNTLNDKSDILVRRHDAQLQRDTRGKLLPELPVGSKVNYRNHITNNYDIGIVTAQNAKLYQICTEHSTHISCNCVDLKHTDAPYEPCTKPSQTVSNFAKSLHANANPPLPSNIKQDDKAKLICRRISVSKTNSSNVTSNRYMTRSGHILKPAQRLISQM